MKNIITLTMATAILFAAPLAGACDYPERAELPNGATASKDEMLSGQRSVKAYMTSMEEYLACIEKEEKDAVDAIPDITDEDRDARNTAFVKKYNAAVEEMELLAARFNEEVRAYKAQGE